MAVILITIPMVMLFVAVIIMKIVSLKRRRRITLNDESDENEDALR